MFKIATLLTLLKKALPLTSLKSIFDLLSCYILQFLHFATKGLLQVHQFLLKTTDVLIHSNCFHSAFVNIHQGRVFCKKNYYTWLKSDNLTVWLVNNFLYILMYIIWLTSYSCFIYVIILKCYDIKSFESACFRCLASSDAIRARLHGPSLVKILNSTN